jgi:hypothetical protein
MTFLLGRDLTDEELDEAAEEAALFMDELVPPRPELEEKYNPSQARDKGGKWTSGGGGGGAIASAARSAEPAISDSMQTAAHAAGGELVGFEHRLKSGESLDRKIGKYESEGHMTHEQAVGSINDAVRYTVQTSPEGYSAGYVQAQQSLSAAGHTRLRTRQYWANPDQTGYVGINEVWQTSSGQRFEVQFHTAQTWALKQQSHVFYEHYRTARTPSARRIADQQMHALWSHVEVPPGALTL